MAVLTFPVPQADLGDLLPILSVDWELEQHQEISVDGAGELLAHDLARPLWTGNVSLVPQLHTEARALDAQFDALDGSLNTFYLANPMGWWPKMDPGGVIYGGATPLINGIETNRKQVAFKNLPIGYVLSAGDMFSVSYASGTRRGLFRLREGATVSALGTTPSLEFRPHMSAGILANDPVSFARPAAKVKIVPGSKSAKMVRVNKQQITFTVKQTLQAG